MIVQEENWRLQRYVDKLEQDNLGKAILGEPSDEQILKAMRDKRIQNIAMQIVALSHMTERNRYAISVAVHRVIEADY